MSSSRLVTKKRRCDENEDDLWRQRSTKYGNEFIRSRSEVFDPIRKTKKKPEGKDLKDCEQLKQFSPQGGSLNVSKSMWLSCSDDHRLIYGLSKLNISHNQRLIFVLMFLANLTLKAKMLADGAMVRPLSESAESRSVLGSDPEKSGDCLELLVDLEEENSNWNSDIELDLDFLQADFPSPTYKNSMNISEGSSNAATSSFSSNTDVSGGDTSIYLEDSDDDEPIFWPSNLKFSWGHAAHDFLVMSPPKKKIKAEENINLDDVSTDEPLVWPSDQNFDWRSDKVENLFTMSPSKKKSKKSVTSHNTLTSLKVDKNSITDDVNLENFKTDEPLVWPSDQKLDWNSEAVFNFFIMSPLKKKREAAKLRNKLSPTVKNEEDLMIQFSGDDQPLFWPYDQDFDMDSDAARNYFIISPRKNMFKVGNYMKTDIKEGRKRTRATSPGIESSRIVKLRCLGDSKGVSRIKSMPAKLSEYHRLFCEDAIF